MRMRAMEGIAALVEAGAQVGVVNDINNKILARDNDLIAVGCFNWLSALLIRSGERQLEERTKVYSGEMATLMIAQELDTIKTAGYELVTHHDGDSIEVTKTGKVFGICFMLTMPLLIGNEIGNRSAGLICTVFIAFLILAVYYRMNRNHVSNKVAAQPI